MATVISQTRSADICSGRCAIETMRCRSRPVALSRTTSSPVLLSCRQNARCAGRVPSEYSAAGWFPDLKCGGRLHRRCRSRLPSVSRNSAFGISRMLDRRRSVCPAAAKFQPAGFLIHCYGCVAPLAMTAEPVLSEQPAGAGPCRPTSLLRPSRPSRSGRSRRRSTRSARSGSAQAPFSSRNAGSASRGPWTSLPFVSPIERRAVCSCVHIARKKEIGLKDRPAGPKEGEQQPYILVSSSGSL